MVSATKVSASPTTAYAEVPSPSVAGTPTLAPRVPKSQASRVDEVVVMGKIKQMMALLDAEQVDAVVTWVAKKYGVRA